MKTQVCFIRHGQTDWNKNLIVQGITNVPLNETGITQAHECGKYLKSINYKCDCIFSSPLDRAIDTANIIKSYLNFNNDIIIDNNLIERNFGKIEGMGFAKAFTNGLVKKILLKDIEDYETDTMLQERMTKTILNIVKNNMGKSILIVAHSHAIKGFLTTVSKKVKFNTFIPNCMPNYVYFDDLDVESYKIFEKEKLS